MGTSWVSILGLHPRLVRLDKLVLRLLRIRPRRIYIPQTTKPTSFRHLRHLKPSQHIRQRHRISLLLFLSRRRDSRMAYRLSKRHSPRLFVKYSISKDIRNSILKVIPGWHTIRIMRLGAWIQIERNPLPPSPRSEVSLLSISQ